MVSQYPKSSFNPKNMICCLLSILKNEIYGVWSSIYGKLLFCCSEYSGVLGENLKNENKDDGSFKDEDVHVWEEELD